MYSLFNYTIFRRTQLLLYNDRQAKVDKVKGTRPEMCTKNYKQLNNVRTETLKTTNK